MVARRFVAVFFPAAEFEVTTRITRVGGDAFKSDGKVLKSPGWLAVYGKKAAEEAAEGDENAAKLLVAANDGDVASTLNVEVSELQTKPPPRYTEATLLSTMEGAGKLVEDEELADAMSERGLGTPATRAAIIEGLIMDRYIERVQRDMHVTQKGLALTEQISDIGIEVLSSPEMTGQWEYKLRQMEHRELDRERFMKEIRFLTNQIVEKTQAASKAAKEKVYPDFQVTCGVCGNPEGYKQTEEFYGCKNPKCKVRVYKTVASRQLSDEEIRMLIEKRFVGPLEGFRSKKGKEFNAALSIKDDMKVAFVFEGNDPDAFNWDECAVIAKCPVCALKKRESFVYDTPDGYQCKVAALESGKCNARLPKVLCKKDITPENAREFFEAGKTSLIVNMISKRGRPFSAFLACKPGDKRLLSWEFPPREPKPKAAKKPAGVRGRQSAKLAEEG
jgi:DNA topoisomerase-3